MSETVSIDHESFSVDANDTSVILVAEGASFNGSYLDILKEGYSSNLLYASFWGFNAAVNVVSRLRESKAPIVCWSAVR